MLESILKKVELTREKMIQSAIEKGVSNCETIKLSKELDHLLNEYGSLEEVKDNLKKAE